MKRFKCSVDHRAVKLPAAVCTACNTNFSKTQRATSKEASAAAVPGGGPAAPSKQSQVPLTSTESEKLLTGPASAAKARQEAAANPLNRDDCIFCRCARCPYVDPLRCFVACYSVRGQCDQRCSQHATPCELSLLPPRALIIRLHDAHSDGTRHLLLINTMRNRYSTGKEKKEKLCNLITEGSDVAHTVAWMAKNVQAFHALITDAETSWTGGQQSGHYKYHPACAARATRERKMVAQEASGDDTNIVRIVVLNILASDISIGLSKGMLYDMNSARQDYHCIRANVDPSEAHAHDGIELEQLEANLRERLDGRASFIAVQGASTLIAPLHNAVVSIDGRSVMSYGIEPGVGLDDNNPNVVRFLSLAHAWLACTV